MNPIGIDYLTLFGLHPLDYADAAAKAGAETIALPPTSMDPLPARAAAYSLLDDASLCRNLRRRLDAGGLRVGMIDGLAVWPGKSVESYETGLANLAELGVTIANTVSFDSMDRSVDEFAKLTEMADRYGIMIVLESCPILTVRTVEQALGILRQIDKPNFKLLIDTMHVSRSGEAELVGSVDPALIGYVQISDAPLRAPDSDSAYMDEAMHNRMIPGEGELPLDVILRAVPKDVIISAEVPLRGRQQSGWTPLQCAEAAIEATRRLVQAHAVKS